MKYIFLALLFISPFVISGEIYKCKQADGKLGFSDKPCPEGVVEERITFKTQKSDWVKQLRKEKPASIKITDVIRKDGDVTIKYKFRTKLDSNNFVRLANDVSDIHVLLLKYIGPKASALGRAEIKVSSKPNSFFDKLKGAKNYN